jgi:sugar/nucleoside kinase (ribokinase family)
MSILIVGATTLDRLLHVTQYPTADSKTSCTTYESGGGNAANTASALARLQIQPHLKGSEVKLLSKVSNDQTGDVLVEELQEYGVDLSCPLFIRSQGTNSVVTVVVTNSPPHTRTCFFDAGTVGTLTLSDLRNINLDVVFENATHLHSDTRHTEVALHLVRAAKYQQSVPIAISVDVERDRLTKDFDELIDLSDIIFTNELLMLPILTRRLGYNPFDSIKCDERKFCFHLNVAMLCYCLRSTATSDSSSIGTSKELIVTRGELGAIRCVMVIPLGWKESNGPSIHETNKLLTHTMVATQASNSIIRIAHTVQQLLPENAMINSAIPVQQYEYIIHTVGPPKVAKIVDTTGAGDAFIAGHIFSKNYLSRANVSEDADMILNLQFASWVAGKKLAGAGARKALPTWEEVRKELGSNVEEMSDSLRKLMPDSGI